MIRSALIVLACAAFLPCAAAQEAPFAQVEVASLKPPFDGWLVVDVRDSNAFNGWPLAGEKRGGHIPGACNVALAWAEQNLKGTTELLKAKGVLDAKKILLYGDDVGQATRLAKLLVEKHAVEPARLRVLRGGFAAWSNDAELPVDKLPRHDRLVPATWLADAVKTQPNLRVFDVCWGKGQDFKRYSRSHVPGAVHFDTDLFESGPIWNVVPPAELTNALLALGIRKDTPVVLYGPDAMPAARAAVVLMYAGVDDVRVLNGGFPA